MSISYMSSIHELPSITSIFVDNSSRNLQQISRALRSIHTIEVDNEQPNRTAIAVSLERDNLYEIPKIRKYYNFKLKDGDVFKNYLDTLDDEQLKDFFFGEVPNEGISKKHFDEIESIFQENQSKINFLFLDMDKTLTQQENNLDLDYIASSEEMISSMAKYFYGGEKRMQYLKKKFFDIKMKYNCFIFVITNNISCSIHNSIFKAIIDKIIPDNLVPIDTVICSLNKKKSNCIIDVYTEFQKNVLNPKLYASYFFNVYIKLFKTLFSLRYLDYKEFFNDVFIKFYMFPLFADKKYFKNFFIQLSKIISQEFYEGEYDRISTPYDIVEEDIDIEEAIKHYYERMISYKERGYIIYNFGDSLEKFTFLWNVVNVQKIDTIPFSGSIFENVGTGPKISEKKLDLMLQNYDMLKQNNPIFNQMIDDIRNNKKVLITDFGAEGKTIPTILYLLYIKEGFKPDDINLNFFIISALGDKDKITYLLKTECPLLKDAGYTEYIDSHLEVYDYLPPSFYINSDRGSVGYVRCTPSYGVELWDTTINDSSVWINPVDNKPNYFMCNLNRFLFLIQISSLLYHILNKDV